MRFNPLNQSCRNLRVDSPVKNEHKTYCHRT